LCGVSMGGMVVQTMAVDQPRRVLSLTSIMSTTGKRSVGWQHPRLLPVLLARRGRGRAAYAEGSAAIWALIGSPLFPADPGEALGGVGVEDVDVLRVGGDVDPVTLRDLVATGDPDDDVGRGALHVAVAVDEAVGAEVLDDRDVHRQPALALAHQPPGLGAHTD